MTNPFSDETYDGECLSSYPSFWVTLHLLPLVV